MKKKLLPISLLCLLSMIATACGGGKSSSQENSNSASENSTSEVQSSSDQGGSSSQAGTSSSSAAQSSSQNSSSSQAAPNPTGVTLDKTTASVVKGQKVQLTATVAPANANNKQIVWSSEDEDVVTVSNTGEVTAVDVGTTKVIAKIKNTNLKAECEVSVIKEINSITIKNKSLFEGFIEDDIESLSIEVDPADNVSALVTAGALKVTSSNTEVATVSGLTITALKAGKSTITASLFGKTDSFELTVGEAIPGTPYTVLNAFNKGIEEAPFNGQSGNKSAITTTCFELQGKILAVAPNGETGYNAILDDGTAAVYLQVNKLAEESIPLAAGDYAKVTCKFTNYYGLLEGVSRKAETGKNASWIPSKDVVKLNAPATPVTPTLNAAEDMTGDQYNAYFNTCKTNGTKDADGATWTAMKYVNIAGTYSEEYAAADKGKYQISDKYGLAPIGNFKLDEPFEGQKSTLEAFLIGANTGKGKSNAIVVGQTPLAVQSFVIDQAAQTIVHGNTLQLTYTTTPAGSYDRSVSYESLNPTIATVDDEGLVTGIYEGSGTQDATIKVKVGSLEQTVVISVFGETVAATAVNLAATASVYVGEEMKLEYTTTPAMVSDVAQWSSDNEAIATVDQKGNVKGIAEGEANITLRMNETVSATCKVTVSFEKGVRETDPLSVDDTLALVADKANGYKSSKQYYIKGFVSELISNDLAASYNNATFWLASSSKARGFEGYRIKPVSTCKNYTDLKVGAEVLLKCVIYKYNANTVENDTGNIISIAFEEHPATAIAMSKSTETVEAGSTVKLSTTMTPFYATSAITWETSDATVATVNNGVVTGVAAGTATITAKVSDEIKAECVVTVTAPIAGNADKIDRAFTGLADGTTSYTNWEKTAQSGAVYVGNSAADKNSVQLRSKNSNSGIVVKTSAGKVAKVVVEWLNDTAAGRTLDIYGKATAYTAPTDLYGENKGTKLGSIVKGTSTEAVITGDYAFIGLRSNDGAMYLKSVTIVWADAE